MLVRVSTELECSAHAAWQAVQRVDTLRYVTRGLLGFRPLGEVADELHAGQSIHLRLLLFGVIPAWEHLIRIVRLDDTARELFTNERGGAVETWNHLIRIEPAGPARTRYTDEIEIEAGRVTPLVWGYAQLFYRYRQWRWRRLARTL
jgi:ligand-binding SRPBCC domain-containing protein